MDKLKHIPFERFKFPLLMLSLGILFMLLPFGVDNNTVTESNDTNLSRVLSNTKGVGECIVLLSENGAVVVCEGADKAKVRLEIIRALYSYTGYSSEKITILKLRD